MSLSLLREGLTVSPLKRRRSKTIRGFKPLGGKSRRYRTPTGETISRRQYENIRAQGRGFSSWSEIQRAKPTVSGVSKEDYIRWQKRAKDKGKDLDEFERLLAKAADDDFTHKVDGTFDDFLQYLDYREADYDFDVGETP